MNECVISNYL